MDEKHQVHHSYIWLGGIGAAFWLLFVFFILGVNVIGEVAANSIRYHVLMALLGGFATVLIVAIIAIALAIAFAWRALSYKHLWYQLDSQELGVYSGVIRKKQTHVPYSKIQSIDVYQSLAKRVFGLCDVRIDTAGGADNKLVVIPYLTKDVGNQLRSELYSLKMAAMGTSSGSSASASSVESANAPVSAPDYAPPAGAPVAVNAQATGGNVLDVGDEAWRQFGGVFAGPEGFEEAPSYEYGLTNKEIVLTGMSNSGSIIAGVIGTIVGLVGVALPFAIMAYGEEMEAALDATGSIGSAAVINALANIAPVAILSIIGIAVFVWVVASASSCLQFGGFRARRRGTRIEVERGLLQHTSTSIDISRVQSVVVTQSLIRRFLGYCEISLGKVDAGVGGSDDKQSQKQPSLGGFVIHPFVKASQVGEVLRGMVPEYAGFEADGVHVAPVALRRAIIRRCILQGGGFWLAVLATVMQIALHAAYSIAGEDGAFVLGITDAAECVLFALAVIIFAIELAGAILWYRDSRFATSRLMATFINGGLTRRTVSIPRTKVQFASTSRNPLQAHAGTATISASTAAGVGGTSTTLVDVSIATASDWLSWAEPRR